MKEVRNYKHKYYTIYEMEVTKKFKLRKNDETLETLEKDEIIYIFKTNREILSDKDIIWEYFKFID